MNVGMNEGGTHKSSEYYSSEHTSFFFFSSRRRHTRFDCDWSSDVCSSDLGPTGEDVAQWFGEHAGQPHVQGRGKAHLLNAVSHRVRYPAAQTVTEERLVPDSMHLAIGGHAERKRDQAVVHEGQTGFHPVGHRVAIFQPEIVRQGSP